MTAYEMPIKLVIKMPKIGVISIINGTTNIKEKKYNLSSRFILFFFIVRTAKV